jgi:cytidylate kinase
MISIEELIARQIALYEAHQRLEKEEQRPGRGKMDKVSYGPYLLLSREKGAGGCTVANLVGKCLGWRVFDREIVDEIARTAQVRQRLIESLDERDRAVLEDIVTSALHRDDITTAGYLYHLKQVVLTLGQHGDVIIVGRGARHILPSQFGLRVRLVAPLETRAQRRAAEQGVTVAAARQEIQKADRERETFIRRHFRHEASDPLSHDLIINTGEMSAETVAEIILTALQQKLGVTPKGKK